MTKLYNIIYLNNQMYAVENLPEEGNVFIMPKSPFSTVGGSLVYMKSTGLPGLYSHTPIPIKTIASTDPSLGLPLIPTIEEDAADLARSYRESQYNMIAIGKGKQEAIMASLHAEVGFHDGYKTAKAKKYSEEDMWKAFNEGIMTERNSDLSGKRFKSFIQSLNPLPKQVEVELEYEFDTGLEPAYGDLIPKTNDNYIVVKRWIYE